MPRHKVSYFLLQSKLELIGTQGSEPHYHFERPGFQLLVDKLRNSSKAS